MDLEPRLARFKQNITTTTIDGDPEETGRRNELERCGSRSLASPAPQAVDVIRRTLEEIETQSQSLLAKGGVTRFIDKGGDSKEVVKLMERLQEAIAHYQVSEHRAIVASFIDMEEQISQQQAIYDQIANLTVWLFRLVPACCDDN